MSDNDILQLLKTADTDDTDDINTNTENEEKRNNCSFQLMVDYIKSHKSDIPEPFRGTTLIEENTGLTLAMYWVHIMNKIPIPKWMIHDSNIVDSHGWTLAFHYIYVNHSEPPLFMKHDSTLQSESGRTVLMMYLIYRDQELENKPVPLWMIHSPYIFDKYGYSLIDYWLSTNSDPIPETILSQIPDPPKFVNGRNEHIATSYIYRRNQMPPEEFMIPFDTATSFSTFGEICRQHKLIDTN